MSKEQHHPNTKTYLMVFGALMALTVITVLVSYLHLPPVAAITLGLAIATVKASLVAAFFMHLKGERVLIYGLLATTFAAVIVLMALPIFDSELTSGQREPAVVASHANETAAQHVP